MRAGKQSVRRVLNHLGYDLVTLAARADSVAADIDDATRRLFTEVQPYTMSGIERVAALAEAVDYIVQSDIPGDIVECGVWKGGSMMAVANVLRRHGISDRHLHLFDTFEGMP